MYGWQGIDNRQVGFVCNFYTIYCYTFNYTSLLLFPLVNQLLKPFQGDKHVYHFELWILLEILFWSFRFLNERSLPARSPRVHGSWVLRPQDYQEGGTGPILSLMRNLVWGVASWTSPAPSLPAVFAGSITHCNALMTTLPVRTAICKLATTSR